jgi:putative transposase
VIQFSVQTNHVHLIVETDDAQSLSRGMTGLSVRLARVCNGVFRRRGPFWGDRYHARSLRTPREVRNALAYVLMNISKHRVGAIGLDPMSSAMAFDGWLARPEQSRLGGHVDMGLAVQPPRTWLAHTGWRRHGLLSLEEGLRRPQTVRREQPGQPRQKELVPLDVDGLVAPGTGRVRICGFGVQVEHVSIRATSRPRQ